MIKKAKDGKAIGVLLSVTLLLFVILCINHYFVNYFTPVGEENSRYLLVANKLRANALTHRFLYVVVVFALCWLSISIQKRTEHKNRWLYFIAMLFFAILIVLGYTNKPLYNYYLYPFFFIPHLLFSVKSSQSFRKKTKSGDFFKGLNKKVNKEFMFVLKTLDGDLHIHQPTEHIYVGGGSGCGKTDSVHKSIAYQAGKDNICGVIYDVVGDPNDPKEGLPITRAYLQGMSERNPMSHEVLVKMAFINYVDATKTTRCNLMSKRYIKRPLHLTNLMTAIFENLQKGEKSKDPFWEKYGITYMTSIAYALHTYHPDCNTVPHVISTLVYPVDLVMAWLLPLEEKDMDLRTIGSSVFSAYRKGIDSTLGSAVLTIQVYIQLLRDPLIYWVLSKDLLDLNIGCKKSPKLLSIASSEGSDGESFNVASSAILYTVMDRLSENDNHKGIFHYDEFATIKLPSFQKFIALIRKRNICCILGNQSEKQFEERYTKNGASIIKSNCGTQFLGTTGDVEEAKKLSEMLGNTDVDSLSTTEQQTGESSETIGEKKDKILEVRTIMSQGKGEFIAKIKDGDPPFSKLRFIPFSFYKKNEELPMIPAFAKQFSTKKEDVDRKIMDELVNQNMTEIDNQIKELLNAAMEASEAAKQVTLEQKIEEEGKREQKKEEKNRELLNTFAEKISELVKSKENESK